MSLPEITGYAWDYRKGELIELHRHEEHQIVHAASGVMRVSSGAGTWVIPPGRALWMPARMEHQIYCLTAVSTRTVYLAGALPWLPSHCEVWRISHLLREIIIRFADEPAPALADHLAALLLGELERLDTEPIILRQVHAAPLVKIQAALLADPADKRGLADWANQVGAAPRTLMRRLREETGSTFRQWRRQIRMLKATEALAAGTPVTTVAFEVGYETTSAFIEAFRETMGTTPARYFD
ncbi:MAG: helix-turn-helix transcriptional regulator [Pseudomonadota bacterium]